VNHTQRTTISGIYTRFLIDVLGNSFNVSSSTRTRVVSGHKVDRVFFALLGRIRWRHPERARRRHDQGAPSLVAALSHRLLTRAFPLFGKMVTHLS